MAEAADHPGIRGICPTLIPRAGTARLQGVRRLLTRPQVAPRIWFSANVS
jgi:hypothetical protein